MSMSAEAVGGVNLEACYPSTYLLFQLGQATNMGDQWARSEALRMILDVVGDNNLPEQLVHFRKMNPYTKADSNEDVDDEEDDQMASPTLCDVCRTLELEKMNDSRPVAEYSLGPWKTTVRNAKKRHPCPFCVLMMELKDSRARPDVNTTIEWKAAGGFFCGVAGVNLAFLNEDTAKSPYGSAREIPSHIDPRLIEKWIKLCEDLHETCRPQPSVIKTSEKDGVKVLRLIDTEDNCIVDAVPGARYLALSYVWGAVVPSIRLQRRNLAKLYTKGALLELRKRLPKTINNAIDLVKLIHERYLWVDSLCLIQDDNDDMLDGIAHMDLVYRCAVLTVIAAHGKGANDGLPGVHPGSRSVNQKIVEVMPGIKMTPTTGVYHAFADSAHSERGWTFQELVLSHRTLIFTKDCIYFRCRSNCWSEDTIYDNFPTAINKVLDSGNGIPFLENDKPAILDVLRSQLSSYSTRKLTKESDMIHAFTGILRFLSVPARSGVLEGLFTSFFDICVISWCNYPLSFQLGRRHEFPSWSWAGWHGHGFAIGGFSSNADELNTWLQTKTYITWYTRNPDRQLPELVWDVNAQNRYGTPEEHHIGYRSTEQDPYGRPPTEDESLRNLKTVPDDWDSRRTRVIVEEMRKRKYHFLHFFAYVGLIQGFERPPDREAWAMWYWLIGADGTRCGRMKLDEPDLAVKSKGPHELVILSTMDKYDYEPFCKVEVPFYWVILIVWQGKRKVVAERRGIGYLYQECVGSILEPGLEWKEIVLA